MTKPKGHWQEWKNIESVLLELAKKLGHFPSDTDLRASKYSAAARAISKHHGGMNVVRRRMGQEVVKAENRYWHNFGNVRRELERVIAELGRFPTNSDLQEKGESSLSFAIGYHGGYHAVKQKLGREREDKYGKLKDERELQQALDDMWKQHPELQGQVPSEYWMRKNGYGYVGHSILAHHGGFREFREKLGQVTKRRTEKYWKNIDHIKQELEAIINKLGHFPSAGELREMGRGDLQAGIDKHHGGTRKMQELLGYDPGKNPRGYWNDEGNYRRELIEVVSRFNQLPSYQVLRKHGLTSLGICIQKHGGFIAVRAQLQQEGILPSEQDQLEQLVEKYIAS